MAIVSVSIEDFLRTGCGCKMGPNGLSCVSLFSREDFVDCRDSFLELTKEEKDMFLLSFFAMTRLPKKHVDKKSLQPFKIYGKSVCKITFLYLLNISKHKYQNIADHYLENGLVILEHGNKGRLPHNTASFETKEHVKSFIISYGQDNALQAVFLALEKKIFNSF